MRSAPISKTRLPQISQRETIEQPIPTSRDQVGLAATTGRMRRVPRRGICATALAIVMTDHRRAGAVARPVRARGIRRIRGQTTVHR